MNNEQDILKALGQRIQQLRKEKGISQIDLAVSVKTSVGHISKIENGRNEPGYLLLRRLAAAFKITIGELLEPLN